jgi:molybdopterin-containing oxidoreductase family membrane subunit
VKRWLLAMLPRTPRVPGVLAVFYYVDSATLAVRTLKQAGYRMAVMSPVPHHDLEHELAHGPSFVRWICLMGGVTGLTAGLALPIYTALSWPLVVGGKELTSLPPYIVIGFECTILLGALFNFLGMLSLAGLPAVTWNAPYDPRFTEDRIGIWVPAEGADAAKVEQMLRGAGAEEVRVEK